MLHNVGDLCKESGTGTVEPNIYSARAMPDSPQLRPSKFSPRPLGPSQIERHRLLSLLQQNSHAKVVLVRAPAGFGKTTLLAQWQRHLESAGQGTGWITIDDDDNDAGRFAGILSQALLPDSGGVTEDLFDSINRALAARDGFTLFLDEAEHLTAPDAAHLLEVIVDNSPGNLHLVVGSRSRPRASWSEVPVASAVAEVSIPPRAGRWRSSHAPCFRRRSAPAP